MPRLVIPADAKASDRAWPDSKRKETWAELAADNNVEIAVQGDQWCIDNHFPADALGVAKEYVAPPPYVAPEPESKLPFMSKTLLDTAEANVATLAEKLDSALDPGKADPVILDRVQTLEQIVALLIKRLDS